MACDTNMFIVLPFLWRKYRFFYPILFKMKSSLEVSRNYTTHLLNLSFLFKWLLCYQKGNKVHLKHLRTKVCFL